jgi:CubicO group peptidase (beta-lactamase class C family)
MATLEKLARIVSTGRLAVDGVPSASVAVLEDGNISSQVFTIGSENPDTVYQACSISKPITALAVANLVDEGWFTYNTRVVEHLPRNIVDCLIDPETEHLLQHVTVRMLVSHTSGLSVHGFGGYAKGPIPSAEQTLSGRSPANNLKVKFDSFPGAQYSYSGGGWTVMQVFLEQVTGLSFPDLMKNIVLQPLGMTRSHYGQLASDEKNYATTYHTAHVRTDVPYHILPELAAAGLWTTPRDLLKAVQAVQISLHSDDGFLKQETAKLMLTVPEGAADGGPTEMALGWVSNHMIFSHAGGNDPGYRCFLIGSHGGVVNQDGHAGVSFPGENGVAVMTSSVTGFGTCKAIVQAIWRLNDWPRFGKVSGGYELPYPSDELSNNEGWKEWIGTWDKGWKLSDALGPHVVYKDLQPMKLKPAASPMQEIEDDKQEHFFVVQGLSVALLLTWEKEERVIELLQNNKVTLHKVASR